MAEVEDLRRRIAEMENTDRVRRAAADWIDPDDAVAFLQKRGELQYCDDDASTRTFVRALARPHLLKNGTSRVGGANVGLRDSDIITDRQGRKVISQAAALELTTVQLDTLKATNPKLWADTLDALADQASPSYSVR